MRMVNLDPIQQVLQAEREANEAVTAARTDGERSLAQARRWAQERMKRGENLVQRAAQAYERRSVRERQVEARALRERVARAMTQQRIEIEKDLDALVETICSKHWPQQNIKSS